ncbi:hypothetical protein HMPREF9089_00823 [Eubacterium brachy ATCC 33089]|nr:hypothetical protein HMPREF9089_00823 [Eubacterium brachy ATCC 33089]
MNLFSQNFSCRYNFKTQVISAFYILKTAFTLSFISILFYILLNYAHKRKR